MKKRIITASAALFLLVGAVLLIAPRIANQIGKEEAHSAIEQFEELKGGMLYYSRYGDERGDDSEELKQHKSGK